MESWIESLAKNIQRLSEVMLMDGLDHGSLYEIIDEMQWIIQEVEEFKNE
jgi:hypothetical protein